MFIDPDCVRCSRKLNKKASWWRKLTVLPRWDVPLGSKTAPQLAKSTLIPRLERSRGTGGSLVQLGVREAKKIEKQMPPLVPPLPLHLYTAGGSGIQEGS